MFAIEGRQNNVEDISSTANRHFSESQIESSQHDIEPDFDPTLSQLKITTFSSAISQSRAGVENIKNNLNRTGKSNKGNYHQGR